MNIFYLSFRCELYSCIPFLEGEMYIYNTYVFLICHKNIKHESSPISFTHFLTFENLEKLIN